MAESKTKPTEVPVEQFIEAVEHPGRRDDAKALVAMMQRLSGEPPTMWGPTMIGFGTKHYRYDSGREGDIFQVGFAPRKPELVLYIHKDFPGGEELIGRLGKIKRSKACLYVKRLSDIDQDVLETLIAQSLVHLRENELTGC